jgi:hypothetical protein
MRRLSWCGTAWRRKRIVPWRVTQKFAALFQNVAGLREGGLPVRIDGDDERAAVNAILGLDIFE